METKITPKFNPLHQRILLNLNNPLALNEAALRLAMGNVIAINFHTFGLMGEAQTASQTQKISITKGYEKTPYKAHTLVLPNIEAILPAIDHHRLHPSILPVLSDVSNFTSRVAHLCHVRIPVIKDAKINNISLHQAVLTFENNDPELPLAQFILFSGKPQELITTAYSLGLKLGAITSMNTKGQEVIIETKDALQFVAQQGVNTLAYQPNVTRQQSYPGIILDQHGISVSRLGWVDIGILKANWSDVPFTHE